MRGFGLAAALLALALPAAAETLRDEATGVSITAPPGYVARVTAQQPGPNRRVFEVRKASETDTGCDIAATPTRQNAGLTQEQVNDRITSAGHIDVVELALSGIYEVREIGAVSHGAFAGVAAVLDLKPQNGTPPRLQELRSLLVMVETPSLRVRLRCVAEKAEFQARRLEFRAVFEAIAIP